MTVSKGNMKYILSFFLVCSHLVVWPQARLSGRVTSENGDPLPGVSIFIPNTVAGTTTNATGNFTLANIPKKSFSLVISHIGYEVLSTTIAPASAGSNFLFKLIPKVKELESVLVGKYDKGGWAKWGQTFLEVFIGASAYTASCKIMNPEVLHFIDLKDQKQLLAFADKPLIVENTALGYKISIDLVEFRYDIARLQVDYQVYSFFTPMRGSEYQMIEWKNNREEAYAYSLMHFMRSLYNNDLKNEGFEIRSIETTINTEKQRIQSLYKNAFSHIKDSLSKQDLREKSLVKILEKRFSKDSLQYYKKVIAGEDKIQKLNEKPVLFSQIAELKEDSTVQLNFPNQLLVTFNKKKEPLEYFQYRSDLSFRPNSIGGKVTSAKQQFPFTILHLTQGIPIDINENGYFNNVNLYMDGFWGWWEKLGTKLPYDYYP